MEPRSELTKIMEEAKRDLVDYNELDSPMFYIKSGHPGVHTVAYRPAIEDPYQSLKEMGMKLKKLCDGLNAKEVISFLQIILRATDQDPERPFLVARLERVDKIFIMYQPYIYYEADNKFYFQKVIWKTIDKYDSAGSLKHQSFVC